MNNPDAMLGAMPRLKPSDLRIGVGDSRYLRYLLPVTRLLEGARQELGWIRKELPRTQWLLAVAARASYKPLQYVLGNQPFGPLNIVCNRWALIPRWETEEWVTLLARQLPDKLRIVDACTGTGCVGQLLGVSGKHIIVGVDVSGKCVDLAEYNCRLNSKYINGRVVFQQADILASRVAQLEVFNGMELLVSNPPYIPRSEYNRLDKSVRAYEPSLALVGDLEFYKALVKIVKEVASCQGFFFEVGNDRQIDFVRNMIENWDTTWKVERMLDSNHKPRCVYGWKVDGKFDFSKINQTGS